MSRVFVLIPVATTSRVIADSGWAAERKTEADVKTNGVVFSESFEDAELAGRGWYEWTANSKWLGPPAGRIMLYMETVDGSLPLAAQDIRHENMPHGLSQGPLWRVSNGKFCDRQEVLLKTVRVK